MTDPHEERAAAIWSQSAPEPVQPEKRQRKLSPNGLILIAFCAALGSIYFVTPNAPGVLTFAFVCALWVFSVALHEFGHAVVAYWMGDHTVAEQGYLSFDPVHYTNPQTTILFPLIALAFGGIGFPGGAVYIRNDLIRGPIGRSLTAAAGPAMTAVLLFVLAAVLNADGHWFELPQALSGALSYLAFLQASALVLNLLPIPGLDGFGIISPFLPPQVRARMEPIGAVAFLVLFLGLFLLPPVRAVFFGGVGAVMSVLGVPTLQFVQGMLAFQFWRTL